MTVLQSTNLAAAMSNLAPSGPDAPGPTGADHSTHQSSTDVAPPAAADGAIMSVHHQHGGESKSLITAATDDYVVVQGLGEISVSDAERLGFVESLVTGGYKVTSKSAYKESAQSAQDEQHPDLAVEPLDDKSEAALADVVSKTNPGRQINAVHEIAETGEITEATLANLATELNVQDPAAAAEVIAPIQAAFEAQATKAVEAIGVPDAEAFWAWAYTERASDMRAANIDLGTKGTTHAHKAIAQDYIQNLDKIDPGALLGAQLNDGVKVREGSRGEIVITAKGRDMSWREALATGVVKLSAAK